MSNTLQIRRGNKADLPTLAAGEPGFCLDTYEVFIGDGAANHQVLMWEKFDANTILAADTDNTPAALTIAEQSIVGRITGGNIAALTAAEVLGILSGGALAAFDLNSQKITSLADPTAAQDAATKAYTDSVAQGLNVHDAVATATTANITLSGEQTIDGVLTSTDRVLVKDQTDATENGIYVSAAGAWARAADMDADAEVPSSFVFVSGGTTNGSTGWVCTNEPESSVIGTDNITFTQFSSAGFIEAGTGLSKTGNTLAVDLVTTVGDPGSDTALVSEQGIREAIDAAGGASTFVGLTDTPADFTDDALKIVRVNATPNALEFVSFADTYLEASPTNGETGKAPNSDWAFDHNAVATGVHGAGAETLLHTGSTIDCGSFV